MKNNPISRKKNIVVQTLENEMLIYDLNVNKAYCLNETSQLIWQLCDGVNSVSSISQSLSKQLKGRIPEELVWLALEQFKKNDLLDKNEEIEIDFGGLNRREVVRKIGFASMVALPLISSIVAPTAAQAASGCLANGTFAGQYFLTLSPAPICNFGDCSDVNCDFQFGNSCCSTNAVRSGCINIFDGICQCSCA